MRTTDSAEKYSIQLLDGEEHNIESAKLHRNSCTAIMDQPRIAFFQLCETRLPFFLITQYLGHHSTDALSRTCQHLKHLILFDGEEWWKDFVLRTLGNEKKLAKESVDTDLLVENGIDIDSDNESNSDRYSDGYSDSDSSSFSSSSSDTSSDSLDGKVTKNDPPSLKNTTNLPGSTSFSNLPSIGTGNTHVSWKELSDLVHCNLRRCRALQPLDLDPKYKYTPPKDFYGVTNLNENENLCLLMGNNNSDDFCQWIHLPYRQKVPKNLIPSKRWKPSSKPPKTNDSEYRKKRYPVSWSDEELDLLVAAGHYNIGRITKLTRSVITAIQEETKSFAPISSSGTMGDLDPKLLISGIQCGPVDLPLTKDYLEQIIKHPKCRSSTFGEFHGTRRLNTDIRNSFEIDLGSDVVATDPLFQAAISGLSNRVGDSNTMWDAIERQLLPEYFKEEKNYLSRNVSLRPFKMLIYGKGGKFEGHRDTKHGPGHFGTLVIVLPTEKKSEDKDDAGGELVLRCETEKGEWQLQKHRPPVNNEPAKWHIFMHGTAHEVLPVESGYRVSLMYQLWINDFETKARLPREPRQDMLMLLGKCIQHWVESNNMELLTEFVLPLRYTYSPYIPRDDRLSLDPLTEISLRSADSWLYRGLMESLKGTNMVLSLEYNGVHRSIRGWPQGVVSQRGQTDLPAEEKSKVIWLQPPTKGFQLKDSFYEERKGPSDPIQVACISIHHKKFLSRYGRRKGFYFQPEAWTHYDDVIYCD